MVLTYTHIRIYNASAIMRSVSQRRQLFQQQNIYKQMRGFLSSKDSKSFQTIVKRMKNRLLLLKHFRILLKVRTILIASPHTTSRKPIQDAIIQQSDLLARHDSILLILTRPILKFITVAIQYIQLLYSKIAYISRYSIGFLHTTMTF